MLQDWSGQIFIRSETLPQPGAILEVRIQKDSQDEFTQQEEMAVLAECEDFYISPLASPNYKKLLLDEKLRYNLVKRAEIMAAIREYFVNLGFVETDTPTLVKLPGMEPYLDVFKTRFLADFSADQKVDQEMYLITSPEYAMKKLLVGGMEKIFQITRSYRNKETFSSRHNPEFTIMEWYRAYASYLEIMDDTEGLVKFLWSRFAGKDADGQPARLSAGDGREVDIMSPWKRLRVIDAFQEMAGISEQVFFDHDRFREEVQKRGYAVSNQANFDDLFYTIFLNEIEPRLGFDVPVILYDYPVSMAALSKRCEDERFAERFEAYVAGMELCNAFTELNDPVEQEARLKLERAERKVLGKDLYDVDMTFIEALKFGMPPSGGNALGIDRLIMLLLGEKEIARVIGFPYGDL
jgi:lysyl-tRNA synthetase class 2